MNVTGLSKPEVVSRLHQRQFELVCDQQYSDAPNISKRWLPTVRDLSGETLADAYSGYQEQAGKMKSRRGPVSFAAGALGFGVGVGAGYLLGRFDFGTAVVCGITGIVAATGFCFTSVQEHYSKALDQAESAAADCLQVQELLPHSSVASDTADYNLENSYLVSEYEERAEEALATGNLWRVAPLKAAAGTLRLCGPRTWTSKVGSAIRSS